MPLFYEIRSSTLPVDDARQRSILKTSFQSIDQPGTTVFLWYVPGGSRPEHGPDLSISALQVLEKEVVCEWQADTGWRFGHTNRSVSAGPTAAPVLGADYGAGQDSGSAEKGARSIAYGPMSAQHQLLLKRLAAADFPASFQAMIQRLLSAQKDPK